LVPSKLARVLKKMLCAGEAITAAAQNKKMMHTIASKLSFSKLLRLRSRNAAKVNNLQTRSFVMRILLV
jgi:hypothetical protein